MAGQSLQGVVDVGPDQAGHGIARGLAHHVDSALRVDAYHASSHAGVFGGPPG